MDQSQELAQAVEQNEERSEVTTQTSDTPALHNLARAIRSSLAERRSAGAPAMAPEPEQAASRESALDFAATMEGVRRVAESLRAAEQRASDLQAGLQSLTERARREIGAAEERVRAADERTQAAEERARAAEERLAQMMELIQREFASSLAPFTAGSAEASAA
jgi:hypothetical protein